MTYWRGGCLGVLLVAAAFVSYGVYLQLKARAEAWEVGNRFYHSIHVGESRLNVDHQADAMGVFDENRSGYLPRVPPPHEYRFRTSGWVHWLVCGKQVQVNVLFDGSDRVITADAPEELITGCM